MGAVITSTMTIVLLFNGPIKPSDIDVVRPAVDEGSAMAFFITEEGKLPVEPTEKDWGLSRYPDATGIEIRVRDQAPEKSNAVLQEIEQALAQLPEGRARIASVQGGGAGIRGTTAQTGETAPGSGSGGTGFGGGRSPRRTDQSQTRRFAGANPYAMMGFGGMPGMSRGGPVVLEGDLQLTPEESAKWIELDARASELAARYKGEPEPSGRFANPGPSGMMGGPMGPRVSVHPAPEGPPPTPTAEEQEEIEKELTEVLNQMFDLKLTAYERKISGIEEELKSLRSEIEERKQNKDLIVERRLNELTGKEDYLAW